MDDLPVVYIIENAQQFWSELDDTLHIPKNASLSVLDSILKRFIQLCAAYHEHYLQSPMQLEHAVELLLDSELFSFHSERMCEILSDEARHNTDPHRQLITYSVLLHYGRRNPAFFRSYKRWQPIFPMLMDHVSVDVDVDLDEGTWHGLAVPIEVKLRALSVRLLYEACRTSKLSIVELRVFDTAFIERLFDLVEATRAAQDESFNYSVIKLIVALNEQFMVAALKPGHAPHAPDTVADAENRVMRVLVRRLTTSPTFGENMIFMLNRASRSPEDLVMQLLVLKLLYLLFTTKGTSEYFYTNDLCVLVDVFLRELSDLDDESESLRHTYLRVLHPLLTKTQLRTVPYKRPQIARMLEGLIAHPEIREITPTTKRLVERCLAGEWHVGKPDTLAPGPGPTHAELSRTASPSIADQALSPIPTPAAPRPGVARQRSLKGSRSVENLRAAPPSSSGPVSPHHNRLEVLRNANESATSLPAPKAHGHSHAAADRRAAVLRANSVGTVADAPAAPGPAPHHHHSAPASARLPPMPSPTALAAPTASKTLPPPTPTTPLPSILEPPLSPASLSSVQSMSDSSRRSSVSSNASGTVTPSGKSRRSAPPPPVKRRKPPAVPVRAGGGVTMTNGGARIETIRSSNSAPVVGRAA